MLIEVGPTYARLLNGTHEERAWLNDYLSFPDTKARFYKRQTGGDTRHRMFNETTGSFPAGFAAMVRRNGVELGYDVQFLRKHQPPVAQDTEADIGWLRPYQRAGVEAVVKHTRGILWMPTGSGKTEVACALPLVFPCPWLFLVKSIGLMSQAADRFEKRTGMRAGRIGEGVFDVAEGARFISCSFDSMRSLLERRDPRALAIVAQAGGLIVDEVHELPADSCFRTAQAVQAYWRVGLSGTPLARGDRKSSLAVGSIGPVIYRVTTDELVRLNVIERPRVVMMTFRHPRPTLNVHARSNTAWNMVYTGSVVRNVARNQLIVETAKNLAKKPCIVFVKALPHGKMLTRELERQGVPTRFVWGALSVSQREQLIRDLERGALEVLVANVVFQTGIDIPSLRSAVIGVGGKSAIATIQRVGRGTRKSTATGKDGFDVYDIADMSCGCTKAAKLLGAQGAAGTHTACRWLEQHTKDREAAYVSESYEVVHETPLLIPQTLE